MATQLCETIMSQQAPSLFEVLLSSNPFERNRVSDPSQMSSDVTSIHMDQFARLQLLAQETLQEAEQGCGALLLGQAGSGKSHLLARLARWADANQQQAAFVYLHNIQVRAADTLRYLLKCCVTRLAGDRVERFESTLLFEIVKAAFKKATKDEQIAVVNQQNYEDVYNRLAKRLALDPEVASIISKFFFSEGAAAKSRDDEKRADLSAKAALAVRWLKGDLLDVEEAQELGLRVRPGETAVELPEHQINEVFRGIAKLARESGRPLILCIDQADNMPADRLEHLSMILHGLIDSIPNLLVVVAGVRDVLMKRIEESTISAAAADRLQHRRPIDVRLIKRADAQSLVRERLYDFVHRLNGLPEQFQPFFIDDELFPLGQVWFDGFCGESVEFRPRDVLTSASDRWRQIQNQIREQGGEAWLASWNNEPVVGLDPLPEPTEDERRLAIDQVVADKVAEVIASLRLKPDRLPADAGNMLGLTRQLLEQCLNRPAQGYSISSVTAGKRGTLDLDVTESVDGIHIRNRVAFIVTGSKSPTAIHLRQLLDSDVEHRILVTDADRQPLQLGPKGLEYREALQKLGPQAFTHIALKFEQYAELDAMMAVVGEARSKDLEIEPKPGQIIPVTEDEVIESYHRHDRYRKHPLLSVFLTEEAPLAPPRPSFPPESEFRAFVLAKLSFLSGANMIELTKMFAAMHEEAAPQLDLWIPNAKEIVLKMHNEELVCAQPWNNDLYLTIGSKA